MTNLTVQNYPIYGSTAALRQVAFGGGTDALNLLISVTVGEDEEESIEIVLGNGPEHEDAIEGLVDILRGVADMLDEPETQEAWLAQLNDLNEEENA